MKEQPAFRFAPSPNGELHLGHALSALTTIRAAAEANGRFILRIEDIDQERSSEFFLRTIYEDLAWLGLDWETPVRRQSEHLADYRAALARLETMGLIYPCFATRGEIAQAAGADAPRDPDGSLLYPGIWRNAAAGNIAERQDDGAAFAMRLDMARAMQLVDRELSFIEEGQGHDGESGQILAQPQLWGDVVLARKASPTSYHLCVVVDDALQGVTHVTRGRDLFASTHLHRLLQTLLELPTPVYRHHRLIMDETGRKLSKSAGDQSLRYLRQAGCSVAEIIRRVGLDP